MHNMPATPQTMTQIAARADAIAARRAQLVREYDLRPINMAPLFTATPEQVAEALRQILGGGK